METQFKIDQIKQSGCSCKKKSKSKSLPTNTPREAVQMTNSNYTAAEEAAYTQHKSMYDQFGLNKDQAIKSMRE
jgi:hypothetical protein